MLINTSIKNDIISICNDSDNIDNIDNIEVEMRFGEIINNKYIPNINVRTFNRIKSKYDKKYNSVYTKIIDYNYENIRKSIIQTDKHKSNNNNSDNNSDNNNNDNDEIWIEKTNI